jgi:23S rRNA-intervening sequence protein
MKNDATYRKLMVWQKSMQLVTILYSELKFFPNEKLYEYTREIERMLTSFIRKIKS